MKINSVLRRDLFIDDLKGTDKDSVLSELAKKLFDNGYIKNHHRFLKKLKEREEISTTGVGDGVAIPHAKSSELAETVVLYAQSKKGVDFESLDGKLTYNFFLIATPVVSKDSHLKVLANLSSELMKDRTQKELRSVSDYDSLLGIFDKKEDRKVNLAPKTLKVVAVTACATGIAHTYMAAEKLTNVCNNLGYSIRVETNGSSGIDNKLSKEDIKQADVVVVATDIPLDLRRFDGKRLVNVSVAKAIQNSEALIKEALASDLYNHKSKRVVVKSRNLGIYQHLMSGVSYMLPFVVGGGILMALAILLDQIIGVPTKSLELLGSYNSIPAYIYELGTISFTFMFPVLAGYVAKSIADRPGLVVGFVAGGMASVGGGGFFGALLGGFLAGYTMNALKSIMNKLPHSMFNIKNTILYPIFGILIVGSLMFLLKSPLRTFNLTLNNFLEGMSGANAIILGLILGTMMAIDLGGPVNKSAYVFASAGLAATASTGGSSVMATVMAAGMVPPLATFVATRIFKDKFTEEENQAGLTNLMLGSSFVTEGAISFAAVDPFRVIPQFVLGSALTGGLVMMSNIKSLAPHGGLFVIFLISRPLLYLVYIIIGSVISGILLGVFKRNNY